MSLISDNLQVVRADLSACADKFGRDPKEISLLAVSKTFPAGAVLEAARNGQVCFGENYLQEAIEKMQELQRLAPELQLEWHFIGPIQSNKTRQIAENFSWVHAVDREKIAQRLSDQRPSELPAINICLQVNISAEQSKSGVEPAQVLPLARAVAAMPGLRLRGLMAVPEASDDEATQRAAFAQLRKLQENLLEQGVPVDTLSMGMSGDMHAAIAEGSTMLRIGSAIFGKRTYAE
ncbi:YggS family pyridoxal phosphate-dependent enzyme [Undibacterium parvum]|uniref:Pyridoxal phosphate homeostasis protein n=1 Tax=Undibacterium parvum TaxID=401471 RepID=A0A3S9HLC3_9BURK|nr:YggS family pyridoxal phosphate-dependent enzyme [Undibacterium parvum]AZP12909.1 YggS family pyridoxal phosphate-dependent enzyme [Undibacterium parvum]